VSQKDILLALLDLSRTAIHTRCSPIVPTLLWGFSGLAASSPVQALLIKSSIHYWSYKKSTLLLFLIPQEVKIPGVKN